MERTNIYLEQRQTRELARLAADEGVSRAEVIRRLLDRALSGTDDSLEGDLAVIDDSFGAERAVDLPERVPGDREEHLARLWRQR